MKIKRLASFGSALMLSLSSILIINVPKVLAANITWTGGTDSNFNLSDAENWLGGVAPTTGDILVFRSGVTFNDPVNDMTSTVFGGIEFGAITSFECPHNGTIFDFSGSPIKLNGSIDWQDDSCAMANFSAGIDLDANISVSTNDSKDPLTISSIALNSYDFSLWLPDKQDVSVGDITGSGAIFIMGNSNVTLMGDNTSFSGGLVTYGGHLYAIDENALGDSSNGTDILNGATLHINSGSSGDVTFNEPLTLAGEPAENAKGKIETGICAGPCTDFHFILAGDIFLTAAETVFVHDKGAVTVTGDITGGHLLTIADGSAGTLDTGDGPKHASRRTDTYADSQASQAIDVLSNHTVVITGSRGDISVFSDGILKGTGTVGDVDVDANGKIAPGLSPGCLNTGNLALNADSTYDFEVGGAIACTEYDQIKVTGTVDITGSILNTILYNGFKPSTDQSYRIIDNDSNDAITGTFKNLAEGATFTVGGYVLKISYVGGDGNDVVLTVQSVPTTPNTGSNLLVANPIVTLLTTTLAAVGIGLIGRRYKKYRI